MNQDNNNKTFLNHDRMQGFGYSLGIFVALEGFRQMILSTSPWYFSFAPTVFGGVIFFIAFSALNNKRYKHIAQGALVGWLVYIIGSTVISIVIRTIENIR